MAAKHSLSNLIRHFQSEKSKGCRTKYEEWKKERDKLQPKLPSVVKGVFSFDKLNKETQTQLDTLLGNFVIFSEVPLRLMEIDEFRDFCKGPNPKYRVPYRCILKDSILKPMLEDSQKELRERLYQCKFVSLTIDGWSSRRSLSILGVIVNFTNVNGKLSTGLLGFRLFKGNHIGRNIAEFIIDFANAWGILNKTIRIGSDNAANMASALKHFLTDYVDHHGDVLVDDNEKEFTNIDVIAVDEDSDNVNDIDTEIDEIPDSVIETVVTNISENFRQ